MIGKILFDNDLNYKQEIDTFVSWCDDNYLELNVPKIKELNIDFRLNPVTPDPIIIKGVEVERVESHKYLGAMFDNKLNWSVNTSEIMKKLNTRLYCLRKLSSFHVNQNILQMFYSSVISSVLTFGITCWGGNVLQRDADRLNRIIIKASDVIGQSQDNIDQLLEKRTHKK